MKTGWCEIHETTTIDGECSLCELDALDSALEGVFEKPEEASNADSAGE